MNVGNLVKILNVNTGEEGNLNRFGVVIDVLPDSDEAVIMTTEKDGSTNQWIYFYNQLEKINE
tara:strand:- start:2172 stop:2360 length:189 start_codon:yes stop_codon:yes gene_type:complete